jgi:hypothetical protein
LHPEHRTPRSLGEWRANARRGLGTVLRVLHSGAPLADDDLNPPRHTRAALERRDGSSGDRGWLAHRNPMRRGRRRFRSQFEHWATLSPQRLARENSALAALVRKLSPHESELGEGAGLEWLAEAVRSDAALVTDLKLHWAAESEVLHLCEVDCKTNASLRRRSSRVLAPARRQHSDAHCLTAASCAPPLRRAEAALLSVV